MKKFDFVRTVVKTLFIFIVTFLVPLIQLNAAIYKINFNDETLGAPSKYFSAFVGTWHIDRDGNNLVYAVDGRKWARGTMAEGIAEKAKAMYGERYAEFLDNLQAYKYFPLSIYRNIKNFKSGIISVSFKTISGRIDQAAGIAFNIKQNGDYLVIRANALEKNIVMFRMKNGRRSVVQWIRNVPIKHNTWYTLKVIINDKTKRIEGYINEKRYINYKEAISGKVGLWSKADSYVYFDNFFIETK